MGHVPVRKLFNYGIQYTYILISSLHLTILKNPWYLLVSPGAQVPLAQSSATSPLRLERLLPLLQAPAAPGTLRRGAEGRGGTGGEGKICASPTRPTSGPS